MTAIRLIAVAMVLVATPAIFAQQATQSAASTPLSDLLAEAEAKNPQISATDHSWQAAKQVARQVTVLPDPTFIYQQLSVGSPIPFAGYSNSDFAYIGIGASQDIPYPGKLRLRGEAAKRAADVKGSELDSVRAGIADAVKADYLQLAYLQMTQRILQQDEHILDQLIKDATTHYEVGQGSQADILQAQVERTKILREFTFQQEQVGNAEAHLKELLNRPQDSPDIVAESLVETPLQFTSAELLHKVRERNPWVLVDASAVSQSTAALNSAKKEAMPDFAIGYMYQNTDRKYRDYYMFTLSIRLPRRARSRAELAEAAEHLAQSREVLDAHLQQQLAQVQQEYVTATSDAELLKEYREGLIPQSSAVYRSTLNAYASNRGQLTQVLQSFLNVLGLKLNYAQTLAEHETAIAHLETLTGATLR